MRPAGARTRTSTPPRSEGAPRRSANADGGPPSERDVCRRWGDPPAVRRSPRKARAGGPTRPCRRDRSCGWHCAASPPPKPAITSASHERSSGRSTDPGTRARRRRPRRSALGAGDGQRRYSPHGPSRRDWASEDPPPSRHHPHGDAGAVNRTPHPRAPAQSDARALMPVLAIVKHRRRAAAWAGRPGRRHDVCRDDRAAPPTGGSSERPSPEAITRGRSTPSTSESDLPAAYRERLDPALLIAAADYPRTRP